MGNLDKLRSALVSAAQGRDPDDSYDDETKAFHARMIEEVAEQKKRGVDPAIPHEWPEMTAQDLADIKAMQSATKAQAELEKAMLEAIEKARADLRDGDAR